MKFLGCDGLWLLHNGVLHCDGDLQTFTAEQLKQELQIPVSLTEEEADELLWWAVGIFAAVFFFLVLRKAI
jgi:hypothetical protein